MLEIKEIHVPGYQKIIEVRDLSAHLHGFIAIHDTTLGPALGGIRIYPYPNPQTALTDALRLAKGMTYKAALAEVGFGGGKSTIIANPARDKTVPLLLAFAEAIDALHGEYIAAEDVGSSPEDLEIIFRKTPYVVALPTEKSSGDPSPFTAWGLFKAMQAIAQTLWGNPSLKGKTILIQGIGHVGSKLLNLLFWEGANLLINDVDPHLLHSLAHTHGAKIVDSREVYSKVCDIFSPCALGAGLNEETIPQLRCQAVVGSANNQLHTSEDGYRLMRRGIIYAPDYLVNVGGLTNAVAEFDPTGYNPNKVRDRIELVYSRLLNLLDKARTTQRPTSEIADEMAEYNLAHKIGARHYPLHFQSI